MKAISLHQPWASLMAIGEKKNETRSWGTSYRGPLLIHAAKKKGFISMKSKYYICDQEPFYSVLTRRVKEFSSHPWDFMPKGKLVAKGILVDCHKITSDPDWLSEKELAFGDYSIGRYQWTFSHIVRLDPPIPFKGKQGFFEVPDHLLK